MLLVAVEPERGRRVVLVHVGLVDRAALHPDDLAAERLGGVVVDRPGGPDEAHRAAVVALGEVDALAARVGVRHRGDDRVTDVLGQRRDHPLPAGQPIGAGLADLLAERRRDVDVEPHDRAVGGHLGERRVVALHTDVEGARGRSGRHDRERGRRNEDTQHPTLPTRYGCASSGRRRRGSSRLEHASGPRIHLGQFAIRRPPSPAPRGTGNAEITHTISICVPYAVHTATMKPFQSLARIRPRRGQRRAAGRCPGSGPGGTARPAPSFLTCRAACSTAAFAPIPRRCAGPLAPSRRPRRRPGSRAGRRCAGAGSRR